MMEPLRWRRPRLIFVNSMSDLFHELVPAKFVDEVIAVMERAGQHTFQVLTKRPERARSLVVDGEVRPLPPNAWLGVSIENSRFTWRADVLRETPTAVRFISAEPLLGSLFEPGGNRKATAPVRPGTRAETGVALWYGCGQGERKRAEMSEHSEVKHLTVEHPHGYVGRRTFLQRLAVGLSVGAATLLAAAASGLAFGGSTVGGAADTLRIRIPGDATNLDPAFAPGRNENLVMSNIYEGLLGFRPGTEKLVPVLAESYELSKDGKRLDFKLRKGIKFHGGYGEVTAADVKFTYERTAGVSEPDVKSPYAADWLALQEVSVKSRYSGTIILKQKFAPLLTNALPTFDGYVLSRKAVAALGTGYARNPIGTGPYELASWTPGQSLVLKKFAGYGNSWMRYAKAPIWDEIMFIPIAVSNAATIAIESGAVDWGPVGPEAVDRFRSNSQFKVASRNTVNYGWVGMNMAHPKLQDINVRRAIRAAIDVPSIHAAAFDNKWKRATALLAPGMLAGHWKDAPVYNRDLAKAKSFLARAGVNNLELTMAVSRTAVGGATIAQIVQANLADIGIKVEVLVQDRSVFNRLGGDAQKDRQLFYTLFTNPAPEPSFATAWFTCGQVNVWNWQHWCNRQFSDWSAEATRILDPQQRTVLYVKMQKLWDRKANVVWVAWPVDFFAGKSGVVPSIAPSGLFQAWNFRRA